MDETGAEIEPVARKRGPLILRPLEWVFGPWTRENAMVWLKLVLLVLALKWLFLDSYRVPTGSMEPTLHGTMSFVGDDRVVVNKLAYGVRFPMTSQLLFSTSEPKRWDIVVFRSAEGPPPHTGPIGQLIHGLWPTNLVKRVVGLPGERIHIRDGVVYADGKPLTLPKEMPPVEYTSMAPAETGAYVISTDENGQVVLETKSNLMRYGVWEEDEYSVVPKDHYLMLGDNSNDSVDGRFFGWVSRNQLLGRAYAIWWPFNRARDLTGFTRTWWGLALLIGIPLACIVIEFTLAFVVRSWRVPRDTGKPLLKRGERLRVNCLAPGLRLPLTPLRITRGDAIKDGEVWLFRAPDTEAPALGVVWFFDGECHMVSVEAPGSDHFTMVMPIGREWLIGRVESVWWPLRRRRSIGIVPRENEEVNAKASYGKEDE
ncbi:MAG: signal peptidase I [FCB group bacterium]|jgi:signal peptidase I|nr:signal peptidase I [FCB group bacterium]